MRKERVLPASKAMNFAFVRVVSVASLILSTVAVAEQSELWEAGEKHFGFRCAACHSLSAEDPPMFGPHLEGIVDRTGGALEDYDYTDPTLRDGAVVWDAEYFEEWLQHPQAEYPQMCVPFRGLPDPEARQALFYFLKNPIP